MKSQASSESDAVVKDAVEKEVEQESRDDVRQKRQVQDDRRTRQQPRYHVILWDDDDHSYDYVIRMMQELFHHSYEQGYQLAKEVDTVGRTTCMTTTRELAELKRDQIHAYGRDRAIASCKGSMWATIEPEC